MEDNIERFQYPVGKFILPEKVSHADIKMAIQTIATFPEKLASIVNHLSADQLNTPYRPGGWTVRQVVHHCADSHMNAYVRFKLTLTEDNPTIKPYDQAKWAELPDSAMEVDISLAILKGIHARWVQIMESMNELDWKRSFIHPEYNQTQLLRQVVMNYEWHCRHHFGHVEGVLS